MSQSTLSAPVRVAIEIAVYLLLILAIATWCLQIVSPFISFIIWGAVIAVAWAAVGTHLGRQYEQAGKD